MREEQLAGVALTVGPLLYTAATRMAWPTGNLDVGITAFGAAVFLIGAYLVTTQGDKPSKAAKIISSI